MKTRLGCIAPFTNKHSVHKQMSHWSHLPVHYAKSQQQNVHYEIIAKKILFAFPPRSSHKRWHHITVFSEHQRVRQQCMTATRVPINFKIYPL